MSRKTYRFTLVMRMAATAAWLALAIVLGYGVFWLSKNSGQPYGLWVEYYGGEQFNTPLARRAELQVSKNYGRGHPAFGVPKDRFSDRWTGWLLVPETAEYAFCAFSDDGVRLYLDDRVVIDSWQLGENRAHGNVRLEAGYHALRIEHFNAGRQAFLYVEWCGGPIPSSSPLGIPYVRKQRPKP